MIKLYDTFCGKIIDFEPLSAGNVSMYVCGPTVYDFPHLGHARCYITWDVVYRYLKFKGFKVKYCRNVTDVDDKILKKAEKNSISAKEVSEKYYNIFKDSMKKLNVLQPDIEPFATECISDMIKMIQTLVEKGYAYQVGEDVYFRVKKFKNYGFLGKQTIDNLESGARVEQNDKKEDPLDFALWKKDEKHGFESPFGKGRPGWHIECSAMAKKFLGETIDIHAGGADLIFPHHENEIAQSEAANGCKFVKNWLHNGFVTIKNEKMSKSLNNFVSIPKLLETYDSNTIRFFILTNHYRMPVEFADEPLNAAKNASKRVQNCISKAFEAFGLNLANSIEENLKLLNILNNDEKLILTFETLEKKLDSEILKKFENAMDDDFNTSKALSCVFELINETNRLVDKKNIDSAKTKTATLLCLLSVLGFDFLKKENKEEVLKKIAKLKFKIDFLDQNILSKDENTILQAILEKRQKARSQKDFELSDKIRDLLKNEGIILKDTKDSVTFEIA